MTNTDPRARKLAESRYRNGYGPTLAEAWDQLDEGHRQFLTTEATGWLGAAVEAGLVPPAESPTAIADADNPTPLRWGLNDVMWGDDDSVIVLLSGPDGEPYWLELDQERAAVLRQDLAGPGEEAAEAQPEACGKCKTPFDPADTRFDGHARFYLTPYCRRCVDLCHDNEIADHRCVICA